MKYTKENLKFAIKEVYKIDNSLPKCDFETMDPIEDISLFIFILVLACAKAYVHEISFKSDILLKRAYKDYNDNKSFNFEED